MLAHDVLGDAAAPRRALLLHGILGSRGNWKGFCRRAMELVPGLACTVADLRGHGQSHGFAAPHTLEACAQDVLALPVHPHVLIGHSFGGKVALEVARHAPPGLEAVVVLDAPPGLRNFGAGAAGREEIDRVIAAVRGVPMPVASRRALVDALRDAGLSHGIAQWMTTNLLPLEGADGLVWTFELDVIEPLLQSFGATDYWSFLEDHEGLPHVHIIRAGRGARFTDADRVHLEALASEGRVKPHVLENAGHWLHTDDPDGLLALLAPILRGDPS